MSGLESALTALVAVHAAQTVGIAYVDLASGETIELQGRERFHAASTMKIAVLIAAHRLAREGKLDLAERGLVENRFSSLADQSPFSTDPKDDSDDWPYAQLGQRVPLSKLLERMIVRSSNLATNLVLTRVPPRSVTRTCRALGAADIEVLRGVEDQKAFDRGLNNTTTAHDLAILLRAVATARVAGSAQILALLEKQELNEGIPAGLPPGTRVAHKTGSITAHYHDAAIVLPQGRAAYVLVVLTRGFAEEKDAVALVREVSRTVFAQR